MPTDGQSSETLKVELFSLVMELFSDRLQNDPPLDVLAYLRGQVERLTAGSMEPAALEPAPSYLADVLADLGARAQHFAETGSTIMGHPTGLTGLVELLGGLEAGRVTILQAAPGTGKTTFTNQIGYHVAAHTSAPVLYVSFENDPRDLTLKTLCRLAGVSVSQAAKGLIQPSVLGEAARTFQARVRVVGECMRIESIRPEDVERLARVVVAHCPTQTPVPKPYQTSTEVPTNRPRCATKAPPTDPNRI